MTVIETWKQETNASDEASNTSSELHVTQRNLRDAIEKTKQYNDDTFIALAVDYLNAFQAHYFGNIDAKYTLKLFDPRNAACVVRAELDVLAPEGNAATTQEDLAIKIQTYKNDDVSLALSTAGMDVMPRATSMTLVDEIWKMAGR